ncbi:MAG TPA: hypothetical protein VFG47_13670 [Geminicoccaceae bacterium]|nr:hypothetical protein [Geminicoccaceae bacterium]
MIRRSTLKAAAATALLVALAYGPVAAHAGQDARGAAGPVRPTEAQMDAVSAGGVFQPFNFGPFYASSPIPIDPALVNFSYGRYAPSIATAFSGAPTFYDGLNDLMGIVYGVAGVRYVPIR